MSEIITRKSPELPWTVKLYVAAMSIGVDLTIRSDGTLNRRLFNLFDRKVSPSPTKPVKGVTTADFTADASRNLWFRVFAPSGKEQEEAGGGLPVVFYFHGGGFALMSANSKPYDDFCRRLARKLRAVVVSVNYRLSPEHRYPCQYEDCFDAVKFIDGDGGEEVRGFLRGANLSHCFLAGDSAGANVAHHVALKASSHEFSNVKLIGIVSIQPFFGGEERIESEVELQGAPFICARRTDWMWKAFLPAGSNRDHPVCNVFGTNAVDISGMRIPATIIFAGGFDPLNGWQKRYYQGLKNAGKEAYLVEYPNGIHTFYLFPELLDSSKFIAETKDFMEKQISAAK